MTDGPIHAIRGRPVWAEPGRVVLFAYCEEWFGLADTMPDDLDGPGLVALIVFKGYARLVAGNPPERWTPPLDHRPLCRACAKALRVVLPDGYGA